MGARTEKAIIIYDDCSRKYWIWWVSNPRAKSKAQSAKETWLTWLQPWGQAPRGRWLTGVFFVAGHRKKGDMEDMDMERDMGVGYQLEARKQSRTAT